MSPPDLRILIVAEHASIKFGGEAALPVHYFRVLRKRGMDVRMVVHARSRGELAASFPDELDRIHFIPDSAAHRFLYKLGKGLPRRLAYFTTEWIMRYLTGRESRRVARRMVREHNIDVVHQPIPVSPKEPSMMWGLGAPVVIGPMNGGMNYPPAFAYMQPAIASRLIHLGRAFAGFMNRLIPGKRRAALLLSANKRTTDALPRGIRTPVIELVENGVDLSLWQHPGESAPQPGVNESSRFVFLGRLVSLKAVDMLMEAIKLANERTAIALDIIGDGVDRARLERIADELGLIESGRVVFHGWKGQAEVGPYVRDAAALVLPSLHECGGAVVLEAMACGRPVIATDWGGPADYLDADCGILVPPTGRGPFIDGLADAMVRLADDPELRGRMGKAGRAKIEREYDWDAKAGQILELYHRAADSKVGVPGPPLKATHQSKPLQADAR